MIGYINLANTAFGWLWLAVIGLCLSRVQKDTRRKFRKFSANIQYVGLSGTELTFKARIIKRGRERPRDRLLNVTKLTTVNRRSFVPSDRPMTKKHKDLFYEIGST